MAHAAQPEDAGGAPAPAGEQRQAHLRGPEGEPHVTDVFYVGDPDHPDYALPCRQTVGFGAMASFKTDTHQRALDVLERTKPVLFAESLGGTESLVAYPLVQTHGSTPVCQHQSISASGTLASNGIPMCANNRLRTTTSITAFQRGNTAVFHMASLQKTCHSAGIGTTGNAMSENIHVSHYSNQVFNALNGNCWSCLSMYFDENGLADGFSQTFPLDWLYERNALIATCVGGEPIERSFGDINQLWIEGAATRLFVRDIVSVEFRTLDNPQPPSFEAEEMLFQNRPNAGVRCEGGRRRRPGRRPAQPRGRADGVHRLRLRLRPCDCGGGVFPESGTDLDAPRHADMRTGTRGVVELRLHPRATWLLRAVGARGKYRR